PREELEHHGAGGEQPGHHHGTSQLGVGGELDVVAEPDEADVARAEEPPVVEAQPGGVDEGDQVDREEEQEPWEQEPPSSARAHGPLVRSYLPRIRFVPASISFRAASRVSSPAVSLPVVIRKCSWMSANSRSRGRSLAILRLARSASTYGRAALVPGSWRTETRGLWIADEALGN